MTSNQAQDPNEYFDVVTEDGTPTGIRKRRADVHRDGDWHRSVHVWVYGVDTAGPYLLLNRRGKHKDVGALALDPTVGGHLGAGETVDDAFREVEEEIGIRIDPQRFRFLFLRKRSSEDWFPGILDRELQSVYAVRDDRPLTGYDPNPAELEGIVKVQLERAHRLFRGQRAAVEGEVLDAHSRMVSQYQLTHDQLLVRGGDPYFIDVANAIAALVDESA